MFGSDELCACHEISNGYHIINFCNGTQETGHV